MFGSINSTFVGADSICDSLVNDTGATPEGINAVVTANNQFACELYSKYKSEKGNIFFSPYSISTALAMTHEGARGKTAEEMQAVFHFPEDSSIRRPAFAEIINEINKQDKEYKLYTANALWPAIGFKLLEEYQNTIDKYYGGKATCLDYVVEPEKSRGVINNWIADKTENKIKDLIPINTLSANTVLVLTNAIYFKGNWFQQFDKKNTKKEKFKINPGNIVEVPLMKLTGKDFNYTEAYGIQVLELPYKGEELSMLLLLPDKRYPINMDIGTLEKSLTAEKFSEYRKSLRETRVDVYIPKFKLETKYFLNKTFAEMGMPTAFSAGADFSGMNGRGGIWITSLIHQAFVKVNEEGTEAAAATAVVMGKGFSIPPKPQIFRADHPFIFIIQERKTGNILFMGRVTDPRK